MVQREYVYTVQSTCWGMELTLLIRLKVACINIVASMKARWQLSLEVGSSGRWCWQLDVAMVGMSNGRTSKKTSLVGLNTIAMQQPSGF
jgi:hypothetical protein